MHVRDILGQVDDLGSADLILLDRLEYLACSTDDFADLTLLMAVDLVFLFTAIVAHPLDAAVHGDVPGVPFAADAAAVFLLL